MKIEYIHASKHGNGQAVAEEFRTIMTPRGVEVGLHHIRDLDPEDLPPADLYVFSAPGRIGKPLGAARRFLKKATLPAGTRYALLTTEGAPQPNKKTGELPSEEEWNRRQRIRPIMRQILGEKGLVEVAAEAVLVTGIKGPLEDGWRDKVRDFAAHLGVAAG